MKGLSKKGLALLAACVVRSALGHAIAAIAALAFIAAVAAGIATPARAQSAATDRPLSQQPQATDTKAQPAKSRAALEQVAFPSRDAAKTKLTAWLMKPSGDTPRPAVAMLHGCSGLLGRRGVPNRHYQAWMRALERKGFVALAVDSATPRGFGETCSPGLARRGVWSDRTHDAYGALAWLQAQPFVRADRVALAGWSQGGGVLLLSLGTQSLARPTDLKADFAAAVAFYPGICADRFQSKPFTQVEPNSWTTKAPMLVLSGEADTWTPLAPCRDFLDGAKARGADIELKTYPDAAHAFDAPGLQRIELPQYRIGDGPAPVMQTDAAARADAFRRVLAFLEARIGR